MGEEKQCLKKRAQFVANRSTLMIIGSNNVRSAVHGFVTGTLDNTNPNVHHARPIHLKTVSADKCPDDVKRWLVS